ncbi:ABC transporter permease subunit [Amycolatopsis acidicola]|uniref:ABC transporter permease subunit n=1 Tax=Amycolatopsis acidicola TaxID=2596893 RepID=A0A5N0VMW1_9PSEU|nr:ABC transporter permease subunit [Amycolatopsis acidicola]KAA9166122.1 ABC transporter permease subunit [Amycolatopsis acidicola]
MSITEKPVAAPAAAQASPRPKRSRKRPSARTVLLFVLPPLVVLVLAIALWQMAISVFGVPTFLVPSPSDVLAATGSSVSALIEPTLVTIQEAYGGFVIASVLGFAVAFVMARWTVAERGLYPYMVLLQTIPIIAIAPILVVWLGPGAATNTVVAAMIAVFPVTANTLTGLKSTERNLVQLFTMAGASKRYEMVVLRVPYALPYVLTGLRIAAGSSVIGAIVGEFVAGIGGGQGGLGYVITSTAQQLLMARLFLAVVAASCVSLLLFGIVRVAEVLTLRRWHESAMATDE